MPFKFPEFAVESLLREKFQVILDSLGGPRDRVSDLFGEMRQDYLSRRYGDVELDKIREIVKKGIHIVHGYSLNPQDIPQIGINAQSISEAENWAAMDDFDSEYDTPVDPSIVVEPFYADSYDPITGRVDVTSSGADISMIQAGHYLLESNGATHEITGGITSDLSGTSFIISPAPISLTPTNLTIVNSVTITRQIVKSIRENEQIDLSILSDNALTTKYIHTMAKYIIVSNKETLIRHGAGLLSTTSNNFNKHAWMPDHLFVRNLTLQFKCVEHSWIADDEATILDSIFAHPSVPGGPYPPDPDAFSYAIRTERTIDQFPRTDEKEMTVQTIIKTP